MEFSVVLISDFYWSTMQPYNKVYTQNGIKSIVNIFSFANFSIKRVFMLKIGR